MLLPYGQPLVWNIVASQYIVADVGWKTQLLRGDQYKVQIVITDKCLNQRMDSTPELQISAKTDCQVVKTPF